MIPRFKLSLRASTLALLALLVLPLTAGCDDADPDPPTGDVTTYAGTLAGDAVSGALEVSVDGAEATGSFTLVGGGARVGSQPPLTGTFSPTTGVLTLSGGGYTFNGTISGNTLTGTWTGPDGTSGTFSAYLDGEGEEVLVLCGGYDGSEEDGTLNIVIRGTSLLGVAVSGDGGEASGFEGTVSGNTVSVRHPDDPSFIIATGTLSADRSTLDGTFDDHQGNHGAWHAERCGV